MRPPSSPRSRSLLSALYLLFVGLASTKVVLVKALLVGLHCLDLKNGALELALVEPSLKFWRPLMGADRSELPPSVDDAQMEERGRKITTLERQLESIEGRPVGQYCKIAKMAVTMSVAVSNG